MAMLHYLLNHAGEYGITLCAVNCEHGLRGEQSKADSALVSDFCAANGIKLYTYCQNCAILAKEQGLSVETAAREWRRKCYADASKKAGGALVATAHHMNDNAETVLFNLARGSGLSGVCGIVDTEAGGLRLIRPMINVTREQIDEYVRQNSIPYADDQTNFSTDYTRNKIRAEVIPALERAVGGAVGSICRFARLAAEDEKYLSGEAEKYVEFGAGRVIIKNCAVKPIFARAAIFAIKAFQKKDYTEEHIQSLFALQSLKNGKTFCFLGLTAFKEEGGVAICRNTQKVQSILQFSFGTHRLGDVEVTIEKAGFPANFNKGGEVLYADPNALEGAQIRTRRKGDYIVKIGGIKRSLGDFLSEKKVPASLRDKLPVIADGNRVLVVCGVDISAAAQLPVPSVNTPPAVEFSPVPSENAPHVVELSPAAPENSPLFVVRITTSFK